jgi:excisionase family DNA binding protein
MGMKQSRAVANTDSARSTDQLSYSPQGASQVTGIPPRTITAAIAEGRLRSFKVGRRRIIFRDDLEAFLRSAR